MIELRDVRKVFHAGRPNEFEALRGVTLTIDKGVTALKGPSGSGKTTLLGIIGAMSRPTSGRVFLDGREITSLPERFMTALRRETFGFIFQQFNLISGMSALDNVMIPAFPLGEPRGVLRARAMAILDRFGMGGKAHTPVQWLSGGEAQRVAVIRALINDPPVIIADEPTAHLDSSLSRELMGLLGELAAQGRSLIISSHDPLVYGSPLIGRVVEVSDGRAS